MFQTLFSIVISYLWYLSVFQEVKVTNPGSESESWNTGSCDETKVKVANPGSCDEINFLEPRL